MEPVRRLGRRLLRNRFDQIKFGIQDSWGPAYQNTIVNGDLYAIEANGVPTSVTVFDTPAYTKPYLNADLGIYLMDTWKFKRLSITPGIRWGYLSNQINLLVWSGLIAV